MTRIVAGAAGGLRLETPPGSGTRPTSDRVREALFSRLDHLDVLDGVRVLDLYAGSGALGLEALSRGAVHVVLVEQHGRAAAVVRRNAAQVARARGLRDAFIVRVDAVQRALASLQGCVGAGAPASPFDLVFLDPPYDLPEEALATDLHLLRSGGLLSPHAVVVVERSARSPEPTWPAPWSQRGQGEGPPDIRVPSGGLRPFAERTYGETRLWFAEPVRPATQAGKN